MNFMEFRCLCCWDLELIGGFWLVFFVGSVKIVNLDGDLLDFDVFVKYNSQGICPHNV